MNTKKAISFLLVALIISAALPIGVFHINAETYSGQCGDLGNNVTWEYDTSTCTLTISGNGDIRHCNPIEYEMTYVGNEPWKPYYKTMKTVIINDGVKKIGRYAFYGCEGLLSVSIPNSVTEIEYKAFYGCNRLKDIDIPDTVTTIGYRAFNNTAWYNSQPNGLVYVGKVAFNCKNVTPANVAIREGTLAIAEYAFYESSELKSITIPNTVTHIGAYAFQDCLSLTSLTMPDSVTSMGDLAFSHCTALTSITISENLRRVGECAFASCFGITSVKIPNSVTSVGNQAFYNCTALKSVIMGNGITTVGGSAFSGCTGLTDIYYVGTEEQKNKVWIGYSDSLEKVIWHYNYILHTNGDISGDNEVDNKDLTRLFQFLSGWDVEVNEAALDINGDDNVDNKDLTRLFQFLSGWKVNIY